MSTSNATLTTLGKLTGSSDPSATRSPRRMPTITSCADCGVQCYGYRCGNCFVVAEKAGLIHPKGSKHHNWKGGTSPKWYKQIEFKDPVCYFCHEPIIPTTDSGR